MRWIEAAVNAWLTAQIKKRRRIASAERALQQRHVSGWRSVDDASQSEFTRKYKETLRRLAKL